MAEALQTIADGWWKIATYHAKDGRRTEVWQHWIPNDEIEYVVQYYDHRGVHLDASDYHTGCMGDAINTASIPFAEEEGG